jgi:hypothetical protein
MVSRAADNCAQYQFLRHLQSHLQRSTYESAETTTSRPSQQHRGSVRAPAKSTQACMLGATCCWMIGSDCCHLRAAFSYPSQHGTRHHPRRYHDGAPACGRPDHQDRPAGAHRQHAPIATCTQCTLPDLAWRFCSRNQAQYCSNLRAGWLARFSKGQLHAHLRHAHSRHVDEYALNGTHA